MSLPGSGASWGMIGAMRRSSSSRDLDLVTGVTRQLGTMLGAGIPMTEALRAMIDFTLTV